MGCQHAGSDGTCVSLTQAAYSKHPLMSAFHQPHPADYQLMGQYTACSFLVGSSWFVKGASEDFELLFSAPENRQDG
jgi:hypothetical protein